MQLHIAFNDQGTILGAAAEEADQPYPTAGLTTATVDVPAEFEGKDPPEFLHLLRLNVADQRLVKHSD